MLLPLICGIDNVDGEGDIVDGCNEAAGDDLTSTVPF